MNGKTTKVVCACVFVAGVGGVALSTALGQVGFRGETIRNNTGQAVNDLRLRYVDPAAGTVDNLGFHIFRRGDGSWRTPDSSDPANNEVRWSTDRLGEAVAPGDQRRIAHRAGSRIDRTNSRWTLDGADVAPPGARRMSTHIEFTDGDATEFTLANLEEETLTLFNVELWRNNDMINFTLTRFFEPTGDLVGFWDEVEISSGTEWSQLFGMIDPARYQLAFGYAALASDPDNRFWWAIAVPAPASLTLLAAGGLLAVRRRR